MSLRCRLGWHDWRYDGHADDEALPDGSYAWKWHDRCQRCRDRRTIGLIPRKERYIPPEGIPVEVASSNGTGVTYPIPPWEGDTGDWDLTCVRPGTRVHGVTRGGTRRVNSACGHQSKDHGEVRYYGEGKYGWRAGPCKNCHCEGFMG